MKPVVIVCVGACVAVFVLLTAGCALHSPQRSGTSVSPITEVSVRSHMAFLASDALNGRGSGTRDEWIAAAYLGSQMQQWGLEPLGDAGGFVQQIEIRTARDRAAANAVGRWEEGTRMAGTSACSSSAPPACPDRFRGALTRFAGEAGCGASHASDARQLPEPRRRRYLELRPGPSRRGQRSYLTREGSNAPKPPSGARLPAPPPRFVGVDSPAGTRPTAVALGAEAYASISALAEGATVVVEAEVKPGSRTQTWNAVGRLTGRVPKTATEVILLSAHLDHVGVRAAATAAAGADTIYNGADDDASGSVAVLELARAIALGPRPDRTIVFAFFGSEESGGLGSRFFADRPVVPISQIVANLQFEMIGRPDAKGTAAHSMADRVRAIDARAGAREGGRPARTGSAPGAELLHAVRQHPVRAPRCDRAHRVELRAA